MVQIEASNKNEHNTLRIPIWFLILVIIAVGYRAYWKITQFTTADGTEIGWLTPEQFNQQKNVLLKGNKKFVLYEFTAKWCPPCQKRERTSFKNPNVIKKINSTFIPVRIDLTHRPDSEKPENKELLESFSVYSIPRCVITLKSGERVNDDRYLFGKEFNDFIDDTIKQSNMVRAEVLLAKGDEAQALECMKDCLQDIDKNLSYSNAPKFLMYHHLLCRLERKKEADALLERAVAFDLNRQKKLGDKSSENSMAKDLTDYMQGKIDEKVLLSRKSSSYEKSAYKLEIGLNAIRHNDKVKARIALQDAALDNARSWEGDKLAELLLKSLDN